MATTFDVLAEPTRRRILDLLLERSRPVGDLVEELGVSQPGVSKHLRFLRDSGFVRVRQDAQRRWYELRPEPLAEGGAWLSPPPPPGGGPRAARAARPPVAPPPRRARAPPRRRGRLDGVVQDVGERRRAREERRVVAP